jgi:hypothetical protein
MKTSVTMRNYTFELGLLLIIMIVDLILMYGHDPKVEFLMQTEIVVPILPQ